MAAVRDHGRPRVDHLACPRRPEGDRVAIGPRSSPPPPSVRRCRPGASTSTRGVSSMFCLLAALPLSPSGWRASRRLGWRGSAMWSSLLPAISDEFPDEAFDWRPPVDFSILVVRLHVVTLSRDRWMSTGAYCPIWSTTPRRVGDQWRLRRCAARRSARLKCCSCGISLRARSHDSGSRSRSARILSASNGFPCLSTL
jgi:hypothetical protein